MGLFNYLGKTVSGGIARIEEKNRRTAHLNRIRALLKREEKAAEREYIALGRYFYNHLRDADNAVTEQHCAEVERIEKRLDAALAQLEKCYQQIAKEKSKKAEEISLDDVECLDADPAVKEIKDAAKEAVLEAKDAVAEAAKNIKQEVSGAVSETKEAIGSAVKNIGEETEKAAEEVKNSAGKIADAVREAADPTENDHLPFEG